MRRMVAMLGMIGLAGMLVLAAGSAWAQYGEAVAAKSPWGPEDEIGTLNMMTDTSRLGHHQAGDERQGVRPRR